MPNERMGFAPLKGEGTFFWSLEGAWGSVTVGKERTELKIIEGELTVRELLSAHRPGSVWLNGCAAECTRTEEGVRLARALTLRAGDVLVLGA